eukprot:scaffold3330_cov398-Pinguiococcus_pyrenoidosus.AAC.16
MPRCKVGAIAQPLVGSVAPCEDCLKWPLAARLAHSHHRSAVLCAGADAQNLLVAGEGDLSRKGLPSAAFAMGAVLRYHQLFSATKLAVVVSPPGKHSPSGCDIRHDVPIACADGGDVLSGQRRHALAASSGSSAALLIALQLHLAHADREVPRRAVSEAQDTVAATAPGEHVSHGAASKGRGLRGCHFHDIHPAVQQLPLHGLRMRRGPQPQANTLPFASAKRLCLPPAAAVRTLMASERPRLKQGWGRLCGTEATPASTPPSSSWPSVGSAGAARPRRPSALQPKVKTFARRSEASVIVVLRTAGNVDSTGLPCETSSGCLVPAQVVQDDSSHREVRRRRSRRFFLSPESAAERARVRRRKASGAGITFLPFP